MAFFFWVRCFLYFHLPFLLFEFLEFFALSTRTFRFYILQEQMDDSYLYTPSDPGPRRAILWVVLLTLLKVKRPALWSAFLSLNPTIRNVFTHWIRARLKDTETVNRRVRKLSNLLSVSFLYSAVAGNTRIPKDYILIYIYVTYYGELNPPSSRVVVSPTSAKYFKIQSYNVDSWVRWMYNRKHYIIYPAIFGQLLSNYLTPTRYKLNQRYLLSSIKSYVFNPIWINFSMGVNTHKVNWLGLAKSYVRHNAYLLVYFVTTSFKRNFLVPYYDLQSGDRSGDLRDIISSYLAYAAHKANSMANFLYGPNLILMILLALTSPILTRAAMRSFFLSNVKLATKTYIKIIGFVSAVTTMLANTMDFVPCVGYRGTKAEGNIRRLSTLFMDALNMYLFRLIVLSKWRIVKENHPWFTLLKVGSWERIEAVVMCYGVWKLMNLNDYVWKNRYGTDSDECNRLARVPLMRGIDRLMH